MNFFEKLFKSKDKKALNNILIMFAAGVVLLIASTLFFDNNNKSGSLQNSGADANTNSGGVTAFELEQAIAEYERQLEDRLAEILCLIEGAGKVKVMVTASCGKELVVAQEKNVDWTDTQETDSEGGNRTAKTHKEQDSYVFVRQKDGSEVPLILKEIEPKIEGVIIVAEGGDNIVVKDALIRSAFIVLGVESHKVQVSKMK